MECYHRDCSSWQARQRLGIISDANLRMLVKSVIVHQNEDKSLDVQFVMNGDFGNSTMIIIGDPLNPAM